MPRVFRQGTLQKVIFVSSKLTTLIIFRSGQDMRLVNFDALLLDHHRSVSHRIEGSFTVLSSQQQIHRVQRQRHQTGEDQQPTGWPELLPTLALQGQVPGAQQRAQRRKVQRRGHQGRATHGGTPNRSASVRTLPKPNKNVSPTTAAVISVTARSVTARSKEAPARLLTRLDLSPAISPPRPTAPMHNQCTLARELPGTPR
ncbi:hypothetical protein VT50_0222835 [Streptomyces antioxidans]|uniref:Uncharacterized protein n=1 Tax=Streptomyces antioxidans TaxID=1507734 RepID=A0A1V4D106_9ACTN|nr:hypothetical protein VT50_0222835 [Streptomyces antioxidans]